MKSTHLHMFFAPGSSEDAELTFAGKRDGEKLLDGTLLAGDAEVAVGVVGEEGEGIHLGAGADGLRGEVLVRVDDLDLLDC